MKRHLWPLALFLLLVALLGIGLGLKPREVPSPLLNRPMPQFSLPVLDQPERSLGPQDLLGKVYLINVWASWCVACQAEHPLLVDLARAGVVPIYGLNYKDGREDALRWLDKHGNPYLQSLFDAAGQVGLDLGVYGVPETYVVDRDGVIRHKHTGALTLDVLRQTLLPLLGQLDG